jgi:hypothetical protein
MKTDKIFGVMEKRIQKTTYHEMFYLCILKSRLWKPLD